MILENIRIGYATNSSSSHSVLLIKEIKKENYSLEETNFSSYCNYEYEDFVALNKKDKAIYLLTPIIKKLYEDLGDKRIVPAIKAFLDLEHFTNNEIKEIVDSTLNLKNEIPEEHLISELLNSNESKGDIKIKDINRIKMVLNQIIKNEDIVILGNYENYDLPEEFYNQVYNISIYETSENVFLLANNGTKIKFKKNSPKEISYTPELIDFKVTNKCEYNCDFCYQESTLDGIESSIENFEHWVKELDNLNVFELAVGGGEPLHLVKELFKRNNFFNQTIRINFTTRNIKEAKKFVIKNNNHKNFGAIGVSLNPNSNEEFYTEFEKDNFFFQKKIAFQFCLGIQTDYDEFFRKVNSALERGYRVVLLSFKEVGRGVNYKKTEYLSKLKDFIEHLQNKKEYLFNLDLDTPLIKELKEEYPIFIEEKIDSSSYSISDGRTSMYIDITKNIISDSSYSNKTIEFNPETVFNDLDNNLSLRLALL